MCFSADNSVALHNVVLSPLRIEFQLMEYHHALVQEVMCGTLCARVARRHNCSKGQAISNVLRFTIVDKCTDA